jgi:hypothetical protein
MRPDPAFAPLVAPWYDAGAVVDFAAFTEADGSEAEILAAFAGVLEPSGFDAARLRALGGRPIDRTTFLGDWCDPRSGDLLRRGTWRTADGRDLHDPPRRLLEGVRILHGGSELPATAEGGQFAYALTEPPYPLSIGPAAMQDLFDRLLPALLPPGEPATILDWSSPELPRVSRYFDDGMEWWGVFLFSIHLPARRRLVVILGSATD